MSRMGSTRRMLTLGSLVICLASQGLGQPGANMTRKEGYEGYQVLSLTPSSVRQAEWLSALRLNSSRGEEKCGELDWWSEVSRPGVAVAVAVSPSCLGSLTERAGGEGVEYNVTIPDLGVLIEEEKEYRYFSLIHWSGQDWSPEIYHNLAEIEQRTDYLVKTYSHLVSKELLGTSYEKRPISVMVLREKGPRTKPVIWLDCGIHAREWVSPPACLHAIDRLIQDYNSVDPRENLLAVYDFYIVPVVNPDGYVYSWTSDRMWRKNRRPLSSQSSQSAPSWGTGFGGAGGWGGGWGGAFGGSGKSEKCSYGVDPNRNFPANWDTGSNNPCDDSYHGDTPLSEAESIAIQKGVEQMIQLYGESRIAAYVSIHAYSQFWMSPYGYKNSHSRDYSDHMKVMRKSVDALSKISGTKFTYGPISEVIYIASGSSVDWAYENSGIKYSFGLELRDNGERGFMLPQEQIIPTVRETWAGLTAMAWAIATEYGIDKVL